MIEKISNLAVKQMSYTNFIKKYPDYNIYKDHIIADNYKFFKVVICEAKNNICDNNNVFLIHIPYSKFSYEQIANDINITKTIDAVKRYCKSKNNIVEMSIKKVTAEDVLHYMVQQAVETDRISEYNTEAYYDEILYENRLHIKSTLEKIYKIIDKKELPDFNKDANQYIIDDLKENNALEEFSHIYTIKKGTKFPLYGFDLVNSELYFDMEYFFADFDRDKYDFDDIQLLLTVIFEFKLKEDIYFFNKIK